MKTISLDHPVRVSFKDGECYHDSATILIANGFPSLVRARGPDVIYPWDNIKHILRLADEALPEPDLIEHLHASVAAIADERNGAKQEARHVRDLLVSAVLRVSEALGRAAPDSRDPDTAVELARDVTKLRDEVARLKNLHTEHRLALRAALGLRDDEANDNVTGDFEALCERVTSLRKNYESAYRIARINADDAHRLSNDTANLKADLASVTEQRDVLKRQLEELRADLGKTKLPRATIMHGPFKGKSVDVVMTSGPHSRIRFDDGEEAICENAWLDTSALPQPKQVDPGGPIWVRVADTSSKEFGRVGRLADIEVLRRGPEEWTVDLDDVTRVTWPSTMFVLAGTGRPREEHRQVTVTKPDTEHQQAQNRDQWRATCLANGAKDCTVYFGPGDGVTFVVEMSTGRPLMDVMGALWSQHKMRSGENYTIREVRPIVDGVKPSAFKHPADNGQP